jgi:hypothetical protein
MAESKAMDLGTDLAQNKNLHFRKLEVKGAWVWAVPRDSQTEKFLKDRGFFPNPKRPSFYCYAFIVLTKKSNAHSLEEIEKRYGNIQLEEDVA